MSRPRMSSSILQKFSPSGNLPSVTSPSGKCSDAQIALASGRLAWPLKIFSSRMAFFLAGSKPAPGVQREDLENRLAALRDQVWSRLMIPHAPHLRLHLGQLVDRIDAQGFAGLENRQSLHA